MQTIIYRKFGIEGRIAVPDNVSVFKLGLTSDWFPSHDYCAWFNEQLPVQTIHCFDGDYLKVVQADGSCVKMDIEKDGDWWLLVRTPSTPDNVATRSDGRCGELLLQRSRF